jgi:hypothetical protein
MTALAISAVATQALEGHPAVAMRTGSQHAPAAVTRQ